MCHSLLGSASFHRSLASFDADVAKQTQESGCAICGARLHRANYPRKARGTPAEADTELTAFRTSFCCADRDCRKRATPPSLLFFDRRVYVSLFVTLASILVNGVTSRRVREIAQELDVDRRTLERWRKWWTEHVPKTDVWTALRGHFSRQPDEARLPASLYEQIAGTSEGDRLTKLLHLLRALGHSALMRARSTLVTFGNRSARRGRSNR